MTEQTTRGYGTSSQQKRLWSLLRDGADYSVEYVLQFEGPLDSQRLRRAIESVVTRHEILLSTFQQPSGLKSPIQIVDDEKALDWHEIETQVDAKPLRVDASSPLRFTLAKAGDTSRLLVVTASPLIADVESLHHLVSEALQAYARGGRHDVTEEEPLQYASFAAWQAEMLEDEEATLGRKYWRSQDLASVKGVAHPLTRRSAESSLFRTDSIEVPIAPDVVAAIDESARRAGRAESVGYLACWRGLLGRLTDISDLAIACRITGRTDQELETAIGPFASFIPLRSAAPQSSSYQAIADNIVETFERSRDWEPYFRWEDVIEEGGSAESAFLPFAFEFLTLTDTSEASGIKVTPIRQSECSDRFELKLSCTRQGTNVVAEIHYAHGLFSRDDVRRLADQYEAALRAAIANPASNFGAMEVLGSEERARTLGELNATRVEFPTELCVHTLFEAQAASYPDRCAVVHEDGALTYEALNQRANDLATRLRCLGVEAGATVGVHAERSLDIIVAILGILKTGCAYVPLDASLPTKRLEMLARESQLRAIVSHRVLEDALKETGVPVVILDESANAVVANSPNRSVTVTPNDVAYVMFTSGTTGVPKGVSVEHRQLLNYVQGLVRRLNVSAGEHMATVSTFAADLGNTVVYAALMTGGTIHVVSERRRSDPDALADYFARWSIDCLKIVPSHLNALLTASNPQHVLSCRRIVVGGEATSWQLIDRIKALSPTCQVFNHYGPTETTVGATTYSLVADGRDAHSDTLPIGRPLPNYRTYVVGPAGTLEPIGVSGELHIGGAGVARGYFNRPAETAERFVPDPLGDAGQRLYRTGDRVRHLPGGSIEFRGRIDDQIKIRGYRVEQAEVEAVLTKCPSVRQAVVLAKLDPAGATRLVGYLVFEHSDATVDEVKRFAEGYLPDYMVPSVFIALPALPLNRNGKVDRAALPAPKDLAARADAIAPRNACERELAEIWSGLLHITTLGVHDNFFELGGHSLSAMQLVSRIRQQFSIELPLLTIFETPTIAGLASRISSTEANASSDDAPQIVAVERGGVIPASFSQERLWLIDQLQPGNSAYNVPSAVRLKGALEVSALGQTFQAMVNRHEVLRTTFDTADGRPVQVIAPVAHAQMPVVDLSGLSNAEQANQIDALVQAHARRTFDLARGPVWRNALIQVAPEEHVVLWNQHHISTDGWSSAVFVRELSHTYSSFAAGAPSNLVPLAIQYADFSQWQRDWLDGEGKKGQIAYWTERLNSAPPAQVLSTDRARQAIQSSRGGAETVTLSADLSAALTELAQEEKATTYITLLSALYALLYLHTGQADIVVGSPTAGRTQSQTEHLIGFFLNTLALRAKVNPSASFRDLLRDVRTHVLGAFANQDIPFERIVEALHIERDMSRPMLYQVMFNHQRASEERLTFGPLQATLIGASGSSSKFDLTLYATENAGQTTLRMVYNADLFEQATMATLLARFVVMLESIASDPNRSVSSLQLLTREDRIARVAQNSQTVLPKAFVRFERDDIESTIAKRFAQQVLAHPDRVAVKTRRHEWTYKDLGRRAGAVAAKIQALVGASDTRVGLLFKKDAPLFAGMLGALEAGQTFVPLDPSNPRERLAYMLKHSEASVLLTDQASLQFARELAGDSVAILCVDEITADESSFERLRPVSPDSVAYILYTSGSTGVPKGVVQNHRNVLHFNRVYTNNLGLHSGDRLSLLSSYGFDGAIMDIFGALLNGATLVPVDMLDDGWDGALKRIVDERVTVFHSTPTVFRQLFANADSIGDFEQVRAVVLGGEEAISSDLDLFKRCFSRTAFMVNGLGPSESTVTLQHFMNHDSTSPRRSVSVGLPVDDTEIILLNADGHPTDVYGEIAIRSRHVALGYWRDEEKTRAAFSTEPDAAGRRVYRMGDIGRRLPDGTFEFAGRKDSQVKIRGFRIELGEVESVLCRHAAVTECAVLAPTDGAGSRRLVAYVQTSVTKKDLASELKAFLKQSLPDYMVPAAFVVQSSLPVTTNGKLDRDALPDVEVPADGGVEFIAPRTPVERKTADLWREVLGIERVGALDDFFAVGGQSLLAMRLISRIRASFEIELPLRLLFEAPTLAGMAANIDAALSAGANQSRQLPVIEVASRDGRLPLSYAQQRMWILDQLEPGGATYNVPAAVELEGVLQVAALEQVINTIVTRHEVLRTTFRKSREGDPEQIIGAHERRRLPVVDLTSLSADAIEATLSRLALAEAQRPFQLATGPLLRVMVLRVAPARHMVLFTMHHIVSDAWSTGVLVRELSTLYRAFVAGLDSSLPELTIQYADFASWQRRWLEGDRLQEQLSYWKQQLQGIPDHLELPLDGRRGSEVTHNGARESFVIPARLASSLATLARSEGTTMFVTLLAAFQVLLHRYTGQRDIVVGAPIAGRSNAETEPLIGFFVNTLVLRSHVDATASVRSFLKNVHETVLNAQAHQDLPFERLVDELKPVRGAGHTPLFQVAFVLQNAPREALEMSELTLSNKSNDTRTAKFDWSVSLSEVGDEIVGLFEYNTDLFATDTIGRVIGHYTNLLAKCVANPDRTLADIDVLSEAERARMLVEWNDTTSAYPREETPPSLFEAQVERTPDAVAVVDGGHCVTYRELNARANRLAHHLRSRGVGPERRVGLCLRRSTELVVGMLAVLKAGGTYVGIDPEYPASRIAFMIGDSNAVVMVTETGLTDRLPAHQGTTVLVDADAAQIAAHKATNLTGPVGPAGLSHVIYTSGSTGVPKGVAIEHQSVATLVRWSREHYTDADLSGVLAATSVCFDLSVWEVFVPLCWGGTVVLAANALALPTLPAKERVTLINTVPSAITALLQQKAIPAAVRTVNLAGEPLTALLADTLHAVPTIQRVCDLYGPSEDTTYSTYASRTLGGPATIGRPLADTQAYVLGADVDPMPVGVPGELHIGGRGLARGYLNQAGLTAERFVPDPFAAEPGRRVYRTGDRMRWFPDGTLEFLGRIDHQVKIRGFRIELGEIESVLVKHPDVDAAVVVAREDVPGDKRLVAYTVTKGIAPDVNSLRRHLQKSLPDYMVPSAFVPLKALPLTPNGKLDRRALPAPERTWGGTRKWTDAAEDSSRPSTEAEVSIARIWRSVLPTDNIGLDDKFFDLGGHSLNAIQVITRLDAELGYQIKFNDLLFQTLHQLAATYEKQSAGTT